MGVDDSFKLPVSYSQAYKAMGDAVAVPVVGWLSDHLLTPLARESSLAERTEGGRGSHEHQDFRDLADVRSTLWHASQDEKRAARR